MAVEYEVTLHPDNNSSVDLYPNIHLNNIPDNTVTLTKMSDGFQKDFNLLIDSSEYLNSGFRSLGSKVTKIDGALSDLDTRESNHYTEL